MKLMLRQGYNTVMVAFSRQDTKLRAIEKKQYRARIQAKNQHPDMKLKHPDWCRDANDDKYTLLNKSIKEECEKQQMLVERFRSKLHDK